MGALFGWAQNAVWLPSIQMIVRDENITDFEV